MTKLVLAYDRSPRTINQLQKDTATVVQICAALNCSSNLGAIKIGDEALLCELDNRGSPSTIVAGIWLRDSLRGFCENAPVSFFRDTKFHDIGRTLLSATGNLKGNWDWATVHPDGSAEGLKQAATLARMNGITLFGVPVLSDMDDDDCLRCYDLTREAAVLARTCLLLDAGISRFVCAGVDIAPLKRDGILTARAGVETMIVGVRPRGSPAGDQKFPVTPEEVFELGATFGVAGRPIWGAEDPVAEAIKIANALGGKN